MKIYNASRGGVVLTLVSGNVSFPPKEQVVLEGHDCTAPELLRALKNRRLVRVVDHPPVLVEVIPVSRKIAKATLLVEEPAAVVETEDPTENRRKARRGSSDA